MKTSPESMKEEFCGLFGDTHIAPSAEGHLTGEQLWAIVKLCKYVRLRARNNAAFNNLMNKVFPYARFEQVTKTRADGSTYPGLQIVMRNDERVYDVHSEEDSE